MIGSWLWLFLGCFFVILTPFVPPSFCRWWLQPLFYRPWPVVFLMPPRLAFADMTMRSGDSYVARVRCIQNDELHSSNCFFPSLRRRSGGVACFAHVAVLLRSFGRCGAYMLAACMVGWFVDARACLLCLFCFVFCVTVGSPLVCLAPACLAFPLSLLSLCLFRSLCLSLSLCLSSGNGKYRPKEKRTDSDPRVLNWFL